MSGWISVLTTATTLLLYFALTVDNAIQCNVSPWTLGGDSRRLMKVLMSSLGPDVLIPQQETLLLLL